MESNPKCHVYQKTVFDALKDVASWKRTLILKSWIHNEHPLIDIDLVLRSNPSSSGAKTGAKLSWGGYEATFGFSGLVSFSIYLQKHHSLLSPETSPYPNHSLGPQNTPKINTHIYVHHCLKTNIFLHKLVKNALNVGDNALEKVLLPPICYLYLSK